MTFYWYLSFVTFLLFVVLIYVITIFSLRVSLSSETHAKSKDRKNTLLNLRSEKRLIYDIKHAIKNEEFEMFYQPILNSERKVVAVEALLRWSHPSYPSISPETIIKLAETNNLMPILGKWIIKQCCYQMLEWQQLGQKSLVVNINISPIQLLSDDFVPMVKQIIFESRINPICLEFEMTEKIDLFSVPNVVDKVNELKELGISIAIDDFGIGYSSLDYISQLPIDRIKIDKRFVNQLDEKNYAIVASIIELANVLRIEVVAEGIGTEDQFNQLKDLACHQFQGFYFNKPLTPVECLKLFSVKQQSG